MSVQTRSQLQASALTITNETAAGANTASRVGGLFDDLADTATLDRERGFANLYIDTDTAFTPTQGQRVKLTSAMKSGVLSTYNFSRTTTAITYTGTTGATLRIAASMVLAQQGNNHQIKVYVAKNGTPINQSMTDITTSHTNGHAIYTEAYVTGAVNDEFTIYVNAVDSGASITISALSFTVHTL
jgi:hypothetical protein